MFTKSLLKLTKKMLNHIRNLSRIRAKIVSPLSRETPDERGEGETLANAFRLTETKSPHIGRTSQNEVLMQRILKHKRKVKTMKKISTFTANVRHSHYNGERQEITVSADSYGSAECRVKSIMKDYAKKEGLTKGRFVIDDMKCDNGIYLF